MNQSDLPVVCIVGSGPGGALAAIELVRSGSFKVIVIDVDVIEKPFNVNSHRGTLPYINTGKPFGQEVTRGFGFGGGSNLWHGVITELDDDDWRLMDNNVHSGFSDEVKPFYKKVSHYFLKNQNSSLSKLHQLISKQSIYSFIEKFDAFSIKDFFLLASPLRFRKLLVKCKQDGLPIEFVENAVALTVLADAHADGRQLVQQVNVIVDGIHREIKADHFILSAGALETPRLVLQSVSENKIALDSMHIGANLVDHPWLVLGTIDSKKGLFRTGLTDVFLSKGVKYRRGYRVRETSKGLGFGSNHCIAIKPMFFGDYQQFKEALKAIIYGGLSPKRFFQILGKFRFKDIFSSLLLLLNEKFGLGAYVSKALVFCYLEQIPRLASRVFLSDRSDEFGRLTPVINWVVDDVELDSAKFIANRLENCFAESGSFAFSPAKIDIEEMCSGAHHAGTMRIGRTKHDGVIDSNLKVFGTENLYVCDLSIFLNYGNSNPTLTLAAFSARLASYLVSAQVKIS